MCGIVGLHLRDDALYPRLGELLVTMIGEVIERGLDSAGVALYGDEGYSPSGAFTLSLLLPEAIDQDVVAAAVAAELGAPVAVRSFATSATVSAPADPIALEAAIRAVYPGVVVIGRGEGFAVLKGMGNPLALAEGFGLARASGWQGIAHTRMATESAVTAAHSHPFSVGPAQCLVHNGSFANHASIRRELVAAGVSFDSDNDSEVGARFVAQQLAEGADVEKSLRRLCEEFDGFYTLLVTTADSFAVVRDAIACKPAIIAETPQWVAMASEYRALADLPGIEQARIFEPEPEQVYAWSR